MTELLLCRNAVVNSSPDDYVVIMPMPAGYRLEVGHISKLRAAHLEEFWAWAGLGGTGRSKTRQTAMTALREAWRATDAELAKLRQQQEWTECKYALVDAGYRHEIARGEIDCPCGVSFSPSDLPAVRSHIGHLRRRKSG